MTTTAALARSALTHEGVDAYYPGYDHDVNHELDTVAELAAWMDSHPDEWLLDEDGVFDFSGNGWHRHAARLLADYTDPDA